MAKVEDLFGEKHELKPLGSNQIPGRTKNGAYINNPMHLAYGKVEDKKCKICAHLIAKRYSKTYYKCALRNNVDSCSPKSDHKVNWNACGKYEEEKQENK